MRGACISYLTIEHKGHIGIEFREPMGNRIFGCDDCLAVCPWNKFAKAARETKLSVRAESDNPPLAELLALDDAAFRARFRGTADQAHGPRPLLAQCADRRRQFRRHDTLAAGRGSISSDPSPLVRAMAVWALSRLAPAKFRSCAPPGEARKPDPEVAGEWMRTPGMSRLFCFGLGYSAETLSRRLARKGWSIAGTARDAANIERLKAQGYAVTRFAGEAPITLELPKLLAGTTHLLLSIPPGAEGDPVLRHYRERDRGALLARLDRLSLDRRGLWRPWRRAGR